MIQGFDFGAMMAAISWFSQAAGSLAVYIGAGVLPCFLWLAFYLKQDRHPEPKKQIVWVFLLGALMTAPAVAMEIFLINAIESWGLPETAGLIAINILGIGLIEEFGKYLSVWFKEQTVEKNRYLDEPVDFVIYMIVAALGFAAVENLLFLLPSVQESLTGNLMLLRPDNAATLVLLSLFRSVSAILLHTLCSGLLGYYMAQTFCNPKRKTSFLAFGFFITSCLHGLYNFSIMESEGNLSFLLIPLAIILMLAITLYFAFKKLLNMKSACKI